MNITKFFNTSLLQRFGPQGSGGYYLDQIEGSTNKVRGGGVMIITSTQTAL